MKELVRYNNGIKVTDVSTISKYFGKERKHLRRDIDRLISTDSSLISEFIPSTTLDSYGRKQKDYLVTQEGFCLLVMGFNGAKALKWKREFYKAFESLRKENLELKKFIQHIVGNESEDEQMLIDSVKNHMRPLLGECSSDELTLQNVSDAFESLRKENYITSKLLNEYEKCTYCITDICCKFENLTPKDANTYLIGKGIIEKRASGYYPSLDSTELAISATCLNEYGLVNYVRYTPKGMQYISEMMVQDGFKLREV